MRIITAFAIILLAAKTFALTGEEIIKRVDANTTFGTARFDVRMVIHIGQEIRTKEMFIFDRGRDASYVEFLSPIRDKGVKYLKIRDNMWMYLPEVDKIIKIAGHMLRQSMMGSDFSYEDAIEKGEFLDKYKATLVSEEEILIPDHQDEKTAELLRKCYVLDLTARVKDVTYYQRRIWVDKEWMVPLKEELFALSGKKIKLSLSGDIRQFGSRYYPMYGRMSNLLRQNSHTEFFITRAQFNLPINPKYFTQAVLTK